MVSTQNSIKEQYSLRWNNYSSNIIKVFTELLTQEALVDATLVCEGEFIKVHKLVLSACSDYFQKIFENYNVPHPLIIMNNVKLKYFKQIIQFMYHGETKVIDSELQDLLDLGETLQIKGLCSLRLKEMAPTEVEEILKKKQKLTPNNNSSSDTQNTLPSSKKRKLSPSPTTTDLPKLNPEDPSCISDNNNKTKNPKKKTKGVATSVPVCSSDKNGSTTAQDLVENKNEETHIRRPPNAFMIFANEWRKKLAAENPNESNKDISVILGNMWKSLIPEKKDPYYKAAHKADLEHKIKYPRYYYSPREARIRKTLINNCNKNDSVQCTDLLVNEDELKAKEAINSSEDEAIIGSNGNSN